MLTFRIFMGAQKYFLPPEYRVTSYAADNMTSLNVTSFSPPNVFSGGATGCDKSSFLFFLKFSLSSWLWFWSKHLKCQSKLNRPGKAVRFSIGSQVSSPISEAITASNIMNSKFKIKNNELDQLQRKSAKMAANGIRSSNSCSHQPVE